MEEVIASKVANALLVEVAMNQVPALAFEAAGLGMVTPALGPIIDMFRQNHGGLWVGGRATLTTHRLLFAANAVNKVVHTGPMEMALDLRHILAVSVRPGLVTQIVAITLPGAELRLRCWGAGAFAHEIQAAVRARRSGDA